MNNLWLVIFLSFVMSPAASACSDHSKNSNSDHGTQEGSADQSMPELTEIPPGKTLSENGRFLVSIQWNADIVAGTLANSAKVHFNDLNGEHTPAVLKKFKLFMVSMGHGSIKEKDMIFTRLDDAHWQVEGIYFSMPGPAGSWVVDLEAEVNGEVDTARVSIEHEVL